ncbi:MAG: hypothetical protein ABUL73_04415, partial [Alphaproteobacteria bacterium]
MKAVIFVLALASAPAIATAEQAGERSIDPSWIGQPDSALRAATPDVAWRRGDQNEWIGPDFARWGGMSFDASMLDGVMGEVDFK